MTPIFTLLSLFLALAAAQTTSDPALLSSYPACAAQCQIEIINVFTQFNPCAFTTTNNLTCSCAAGNRAATAACESVSCTPTDYSTTQTLAQQLCGPLYSNGTLSSSTVSAAIASATAAAVAALSGKDVTNPQDWPPCATACQLQNIPASDCGTLANASCVCNNGPLNAALGACEQPSCSTADLETIEYLSFALCKNVGGVGNASEIANQTIATQTAGSVPLPPTGSTVPFTGQAGWSGVEAGSWMLLSAAAALGALSMFV